MGGDAADTEKGGWMKRGLAYITSEMLAKRVVKFGLTAGAIADCCGLTENQVEQVLRGIEPPPLQISVFISMYGSASPSSRAAILRAVKDVKGIARPCREWRQVPYCSRYEVSNDGIVRRIANGAGAMSGHALKLTKAGGYGHLAVTVYRDNGSQWRAGVHRIVALAFIGPPLLASKTLVCHRDGNPANNRPENLYWGDHIDNGADMVRHMSLDRPIGVKTVGSGRFKFRRLKKDLKSQIVKDAGEQNGASLVRGRS